MSGEHKIFKPLKKLKKVKVTLSGKRKQKSVILNNNFVDNDVIRAHGEYCRKGRLLFSKKLNKIVYQNISRQFKKLSKYYLSYVKKRGQI